MLNESFDMKLTYEEALEKAGGFGRFQITLLAIITFCIFSGDLIINNLAFLELLPKFECQFADNLEVWVVCTQDEFCPDFGRTEEELAINYRVDWSDKMSFQNWISRLDL